jgi:hypothetical protein
MALCTHTHIHIPLSHIHVPPRMMKLKVAFVSERRTAICLERNPQIRPKNELLILFSYPGKSNQANNLFPLRTSTHTLSHTQSHSHAHTLIDVT